MVPDKSHAERAIDVGELDRDFKCSEAGGCNACPDSEHCRAVRIVFGVTSEAMENSAEMSRKEPMS